MCPAGDFVIARVMLVYWFAVEPAPQVPTSTGRMLMKLGLNVGNTDRIIRVIAGFALIMLAYSSLVTGAAAMAVYVIGAVAILTGVIRFCPAYTLFGLDTGAGKS